MPLQIIALTPDFAVSPQLATTDFASLVQQGFKTVINNTIHPCKSNVFPVSYFPVHNLAGNQPELLAGMSGVAHFRLNPGGRGA